MDKLLYVVVFTLILSGCAEEPKGPCDSSPETNPNCIGYINPGYNNPANPVVINDGNVITYSYDEAGRLINTSNSSINTSTAYTYDDAGNIETIIEGNE